MRDEGDRAPVEAHPAVYHPAFGGYDPIAIARERAVPGHPLRLPRGFWHARLRPPVAVLEGSIGR